MGKTEREVIMPVCTEYKNILLADVTNELDEAQEFAWKSHLKKCDTCRQEKEALKAMVTRLKHVAPLPTLSQKEAGAMVANINRHLAAPPKATFCFAQLIKSPQKLIPALATACLLLIGLGIFWSQHHPLQPRHQAMIRPLPEEAIDANDIDIVTNFELLKDFDAIQKLVQVVDHEKTAPPSGFEHNNSHGSVSYENNKQYS